MSKPYCGVHKVPKNRTLGTLNECLKAGQVRYYGREAYLGQINDYIELKKQEAKKKRAEANKTKRAAKVAVNKVKTAVNKANNALIKANEKEKQAKTAEKKAKKPITREEYFNPQRLIASFKKTKKIPKNQNIHDIIKQYKL